MVAVENMFSPTGFIDTPNSELIMDQQLDAVQFNNKVHISGQIDKSNIQACSTGCGYRGIYYCEKCGAHLCGPCDEESLCFNTLEKVREEQEGEI